MLTCGEVILLSGRMNPTDQIHLTWKGYTITGHADSYLAGGGSAESELEGFLEDFIHPGATCMDIGANVGLTTLLMRRVLGPQSEIHAFEPGKNNFRLLEANIMKNNLHNITLVRAACGRSSLASVPFNEFSAWGSIDLAREAVDDNDPPCISLDDYSRNLKLTGSIDFIKIDVEGFELDVIEGLRSVVENSNPYVYLELNAWAILSNARLNPIDFLEELSKMFQYTYILIKGGHGLIKPIDIKTVQGRRSIVHDNIVVNGSVDDIVVSNKPLCQTKEAVIKRLNRTRAELELTRAELDWIKNSSSWILTKPFRAMKGMLHNAIGFKRASNNKHFV